MGDKVAEPKKQVAVKTGDRHRIMAAPLQITLREPGPDYIYPEPSTPIVGKWLYILDKDAGKVYAEVFADGEDAWQVRYSPAEFKKAFKPDKFTAGRLAVQKPLLESEAYRSFLSPIRATPEAIDLLLRRIDELVPLREIGKLSDGTSWCQVVDHYLFAERLHREHYTVSLLKWEGFVSDRKRQGELFIASVLSNWTADGDPADVKDELADARAPEKLIERYKDEEKRLRSAAERDMEWVAVIIQAVQHNAVDLSALTGGAESLAVGLIHWGIVSGGLLRTSVGRVLAGALFARNESLPAKLLFGESTNPDLPSAFNIYRKAHIAAVFTVTELLAAKVKHLRDAAPGLSPLEKVQLYLKNLSIETELKGNYKIIHERLEAGDAISKKLKGTKRARVQSQYQKLVKTADAAIPTFDEKATKTLAIAERLETGRATAAAMGASIGLLLEMASLLSAIEDYRKAFPQDDTQKLIGVVGAAGDFYGILSEVMEKFAEAKKFWHLTGGAIGFVSGMIDAVDAQDKAMKSAFNNQDYGAAAGHAITAVGASMTAFAAGVLLAKSISAGAVTAGPMGAIVGAIGAGLMATGMLVVAFFSDNEYETFARHCFFGKKSTIRVTPEWATVPFGGSGIDAEVQALYDLLYRYKVEFALTTKSTLYVNSTELRFSGIRLSIIPGYVDAAKSTFVVDLDVRPVDAWVRDAYKFKVSGLRLPDADSRTYTDPATGARRIDRYWSVLDLFRVDQEGYDRIRAKFPRVVNLHLYNTRFEYSVQLMEDGVPVGQPVRAIDDAGGHKQFGSVTLAEWNHVDV